MGDGKNVHIYGRMSDDQKAAFGKDVIAKLKSIIGGYGELTVLAEYIAVMLQSSRPEEQIRVELEAFLQDASGPFTDWLFFHMAKTVGEEGGPVKRRRRRTAVVEEPAPVEPPVVRLKKSKKAEKEPKAQRESKQAPPVVAPPVASGREKRRAAVEDGVRLRRRDVAEGGVVARSRSRPRRRQQKEAAPVEAVDNDSNPKAVLTPNVQSAATRGDPYKEPDVAGHGLPPDARWQFQADAPPGVLQPTAHLQPPPGYHGDPNALYAPPGQLGRSPYDAHGRQPAAAASDAPPGYHGAPAAPPTRARGSNFAIKKWKVIRPNVVVKATEALDSAEIQTLKDGEIVEQVSPAFKLSNGIIRIQIRHPSSPQFPNPIGWVTQDATSAGGPKFMEPGPEPMYQQSWTPRPAAAPSSASQPWRPRGPPAVAAAAAASQAPAARWTGAGFGNLTWTPGGGSKETIVAAAA